MQGWGWGLKAAAAAGEQRGRMFSKLEDFRGFGFYGFTAKNGDSVVGGGVCNTASAYNVSIGGGINNIASGYSSTVAGGFYNTVSNCYTTVGGGVRNTASGEESTVGGGTSQVEKFRKRLFATPVASIKEATPAPALVPCYF
jgi:hypothetical protein